MLADFFEIGAQARHVVLRGATEHQSKGYAIHLKVGTGAFTNKYRVVDEFIIVGTNKTVILQVRQRGFYLPVGLARRALYHQFAGQVF